jgi:hypothetical protein
MVLFAWYDGSFFIQKTKKINMILLSTHKQHQTQKMSDDDSEEELIPLYTERKFVFNGYEIITKRSHCFEFGYGYRNMTKQELQDDSKKVDHIRVMKGIGMTGTILYCCINEEEMEGCFVITIPEIEVHNWMEVFPFIATSFPNVKCINHRHVF